MMSEDSDYTSDINYPLQHQHNTSAHQYRGDYDDRFHTQGTGGYDGQGTGGYDGSPYDQSYYQEDYDRRRGTNQVPYDYDDRYAGFERYQGGTRGTPWYAHVRSAASRSDSGSE